MPLEIDKARRGVYAFLSRVLTREIELEEMEALREAVNSLPPWLGSKASKALDGDDEEVYLSLKVDFTKTLLLYIHPYESVFRDPSGLLCTDLSVSVKRYYQQAGFEPDLASTGVRCFDHIGLELEFMARLIEEGDVSLQARFMEEHLGRWAPVLGIVISETAFTGFYKAIGEMLAHFILADHEYLSGEAHG